MANSVWASRGFQVSGGDVSLATSGYLNWGTTFGTGGYGLRDNAGTIEFKDVGGSWAPVASSSSGGGWQRVGTVVSLVTGTDTLASNLRPTDATYTLGDITHRWSNAFFASDGGISFSGGGGATPIVVKGGNDGFTTTLSIDNASYGYVEVLFPSFTDIISGGVLELVADGYNQILKMSASGIGITGSIGGGGGTADTLILKSSTDLTNFLGIYSFIHAGDTDRNVIHTQMYGQADHVTRAFESGHVMGGRNADATLVDVAGIGVEAVFSGATGSTLTDWQTYWYDYINSRSIMTVNSAFPFAVQLGAGYSISVPGVVTGGSFAVGATAGIDTTITTSSLVGKTITVTKGIITGFA